MELPKTAMAVIKFFGLCFLKPNRRATMRAEAHDTSVWTTKMAGMIARSMSFSAVSCEASLVKTSEC